MKCVKCGKTDVPLYRTGPRGEGQDPKWTCEECMSTPPDKDIKELCDLLHHGGEK